MKKTETCRDFNQLLEEASESFGNLSVAVSNPANGLDHNTESESPQERFTRQMIELRDQLMNQISRQNHLQASRSYCHNLNEQSEINTPFLQIDK